MLAPAASLLIAAAFAGCGPLGDGEDDGTALSAEELGARGDEICRAAADRAAELRTDAPTTPQQSARFTEDLIAVFTDEIGELRELQPPDEKRTALERYIRARTEAVEFLEQGLAAAESEDAEAYADAQAGAAAGQVRRAELAREAGFTECSRPLAAGGE